MLYIITEQDKNLILQKTIEYKYRFFIKRNDKIVDSIESIISIGAYTIDAESDVRRTVSLIIYL